MASGLEKEAAAVSIAKPCMGAAAGALLLLLGAGASVGLLTINNNLILAGTTVMVGAQNMHWADQGAWTGEVSPPMVYLHHSATVPPVTVPVEAVTDPVTVNPVPL